MHVYIMFLYNIIAKHENITTDIQPIFHYIDYTSNSLMFSTV